ncbi:unnamed protein product [Rotaria socialis]|uniref:SAM domain-containing protein n=1 Tax=Rotaria socialis TaxID=392032 RepID=A0A818VM30_9BILA|nr:unnamed protein product [Rotaria socialis]CAF4469008.1 unnamed protein product [Rotaria socialis]
MIASSRSAPIKKNNSSIPDDSSPEEQHDWNSYLIETNSEAASASNFRQALNPPVNEFSVGEKLESIDPRNQDSWCIGTIIEKDGPRLRIRLDGTDDRNDFWRLVDSADIRCYGATTQLGGQIVPPLGFQLNSTRWAKYFEKHVKNGPFAHQSCFKPLPPKPEKNQFKRGQKLEAVDPKHPHIICPATISNIIPGDYRIVLSLDGWSSSNNFKVDYLSRDIFPVGWCRLAGIRIAKVGGNPYSRTSTKMLGATLNKQHGHVQHQQSENSKTTILSSSNDSTYSRTTMDEKNNNLTAKRKINEVSEIKKVHKCSTDLNQTDDNIKTKPPIVTVYFNYVGDNSGMLLDPQKFRSCMLSVFGPDKCHTVLTSIFDACIKCAFQETSFTKRILEIFPAPKDEEKDSYVKIKLKNGTIVYIQQLETLDGFWEAISTLQNIILSGNDLFISTKPISMNNQNLGNDSSSSSFLDSWTVFDKSTVNNKNKRKSTELITYPEKKTSINNGKVARSNLNERTIYNKKSSLTTQSTSTIKQQQQQQQNLNSKSNQNNHKSRDYETFTPGEVATFVRSIDPSFDSLASRFLQEEIDGKALLLLTTDTLMRHMGLKLGPSLKIVHHIEQLKKS